MQCKRHKGCTHGHGHHLPDRPAEWPYRHMGDLGLRSRAIGRFAEDLGSTQGTDRQEVVKPWAHLLYNLSVTLMPVWPCGFQPRPWSDELTNSSCTAVVLQSGAGLLTSAASHASPQQSSMHAAARAQGPSLHMPPRAVPDNEITGFLAGCTGGYMKPYHRRMVGPTNLGRCRLINGALC